MFRQTRNNTTINFMSFLSTILLAISLLFTPFPEKSDKSIFDETFRPQFHFTPESNKMGDPNGLVFYDKEYHMYYQYSPEANDSAPFYWGHTASTDLLHWQHLPIALQPDENESECSSFSGSAIVDENNTLGKQTGEDKTLVAFYTSKYCGQRIAYSTNKGKSWEELESNPIIEYDEKDDASDPKVIWHEPSQKWVMVLYRKLSEKDNSKGVSFYTSENLVDWKWESHIPGFYRCPDLVEFQVTNRPNEKKWILFDGDGSYLLGNFDGKDFSSETGKMKSDWGKNYFATQTWSNISEEDGRIIQIASMRDGEFPNMPFKGQMSFPCELSVTNFPSGYKLVRKPIAEIEKIHKKNYLWENKNVIPGVNDNKLKRVSGDCLHIIGEFDIKTSDNFGIMLRHSNKTQGTEILYNVKRGVLTVLGCTVPLPAVNNKIKLEILLDRTSVEVFANDGQTVISNCFIPDEKALDVVLYTNGGELGIDKLEVYELESIWKEQ
jgi:sucrose-6-phosphate hydrolase SacC (GH32 family)